jgi:prolyl-tRNA synthetase
MRQSKLFLRTSKEASKEAESISHQLLLRGFFIDQLTSGVWSFLPMGLRVHKKIENIIRQELNAIGGQEISLPVLQPKNIWLETGRWETIDPPLFKLKDRHNKELALGPTHEEVITLLAKKFIQSYKDLPFALYQIQTKFRNEMRATGGLLRTREFTMKDLYSFHTDKKDLDNYYQKVLNAYEIIYERCGFSAIALEADTGSIGGYESHEFLVGAESGEDKILICPMCAWKSKEETAGKIDACPKCSKKLEIRNGIEVGHIFKLGTKYSQAMELTYLDKNGKKQLVEMGCYGIGVGRLMATVIEAHHDENGMIWPEEIAPFKYHLLVFDQDDKKVKDFADEVYQKLIEAGEDSSSEALAKDEVLYDDREVSPGIKLKDADLLGMPERLIISKKTGGQIEFKKRNEKEPKLIDFKNLPC